MGATTVTGTGPGDSGKRIAYLSNKLPKSSFTTTSSNPQDLITEVPPSGGGGDLPPCNPQGGNPRGFQAVDLQCCRNNPAQVASGNYSFIAAGCDNTASGDYSHAEGYHNTASGNASHAEGSHSVASGLVSHAEGGSTTASGSYSHSEGRHTHAAGFCSHAEGGHLVLASGSCWYCD